MASSSLYRQNDRKSNRRPSGLYRTVSHIPSTSNMKQAQYQQLMKSPSSSSLSSCFSKIRTVSLLLMVIWFFVGVATLLVQWEGENMKDFRKSDGDAWSVVRKNGYFGKLGKFSGSGRAKGSEHNASEKRLTDEKQAKGGSIEHAEQSSDNRIDDEVVKVYYDHYATKDGEKVDDKSLPPPSAKASDSDASFEKLMGIARRGVTVEIDRRYTWLYDFPGYSSILEDENSRARVVNYTPGVASAKCGEGNPSVASPPMAVFGPGFVDGTGRRLEITGEAEDGKSHVSGHVYEVAGGWEAHAPYHREHVQRQDEAFMVPTIDVQASKHDREADRVVSNPVLVLAQHHGRTFFHVMREVVPRFLAFYPFIMAHPELKVAISKSDALEKILIALGLPKTRIVQLGYNKFRLIRTAYYPPPLPHTMNKFYPPCAADSVVSILRSLHMKESAFSAASNKKEFIVLMRRGRGFGADGNCIGKRCMANYPEVLKGIEGRFGDRYEIKEFGHSDGIIEGLKLFGDAQLKAIVGMHGAGFQNLAFVQRSGVVAIHISSKKHTNFYRTIAEKANAKYLSLINDNECHTCSNIHVDVEELLKTLGDHI